MGTYTFEKQESGNMYRFKDGEFDGLVTSSEIQLMQIIDQHEEERASLIGVAYQEALLDTALVQACQRVEQLQELLDIRTSKVKALKEAMAEFVHRVEIGEVRSKKTYKKFKKLLTT